MKKAVVTSTPDKKDKNKDNWEDQSGSSCDNTPRTKQWKNDEKENLSQERLQKNFNTMFKNNKKK